MSGLEDMIATLRSLERLPEDAAKRAAPLLEEALRATAKAGIDPDGHAWQPKKDGEAPLVHAADHIHVTAVGTVVRARLEGPTVYHHFGAGSPKRRVLPDPGTMPPAVASALAHAASQAFDAAGGI